jgi:chromate transporter
VTAGGWCSLLAGVTSASLLSVGGAIAVAPELRRLIVDRLQLLTDPAFASSLAVAQAAPGPNALYVAILGYDVAGLAGAAVVLAAFLLPTTALALAVTRWSRARARSRALVAFKVALAPISIGLTLSTCWMIASSAAGAAFVIVALGSALLVWRTRIHLLWLVAAGAVLGAAGWL